MESHGCTSGVIAVFFKGGFQKARPLIGRLEMFIELMKYSPPTPTSPHTGSNMCPDWHWVKSCLNLCPVSSRITTQILLLSVSVKRDIKQGEGDSVTLFDLPKDSRFSLVFMALSRSL